MTGGHGHDYLGASHADDQLLTSPKRSSTSAHIPTKFPKQLSWQPRTSNLEEVSPPLATWNLGLRLSLGANGPWRLLASASSAGNCAALTRGKAPS